MNRIFYALFLVAFVYAAWRDVTWSPPPPPAPVAEEVVVPSDPEVAALEARVRALERAETPVPYAVTRPMDAFNGALFERSRAAVELVIRLIGIMAFFLGIMKIAEHSGLLGVLAQALRPVLTRLFPEVPPDHPAMGAMIMNFSANALGLGNAATPFGIKAMQELDRLNRHGGTATNAMARFLAINTSAVTLLPTGVIGIREAIGSSSPAAILPTTLFATLLSTSAALLATGLFARWSADPADITPAEAVRDLPPPAVDAESGGSWPLWGTLLAFAAFVAFVLVSLRHGDTVGPWLVPLIVVGMLTFGAARGVDVYAAFVEGAREGWDVAVRIVPYLVGILVAVGVFDASGALDILVRALDPLTSPLGLPAEALPMALIRPLSGSGAMGVMVAILEDPATGPDTYTGMLVSTLNGSTETTFYVLAIYFGAVGVQRVRHTLAAALTADLFGIVGSVLACTAWFTFNG